MDNATFIVDTIERYATTTRGAKRAHAKGKHFTGKLQLNATGQRIFDLKDTHLDVIIRLSDAPPNRNVPSHLVPLKGLALHIKQEHINIVMVTFPYFPWTKEASIVKIAQYVHAIHKSESKLLKLNLLRYLLKIEGFDKHLIKFILHQPIKTSMNQTFHNLHYFKYNEQFVRFHARKRNNQITLYAEIYDEIKPISELRKDAVIEEIGRIEITSETSENYTMFAPLKTGSLEPIYDEILNLRSQMYKISNQHRNEEGISLE
ncbi:hypothetical protein [Macrococcoides canis]|uniref:hypothetical protein n=1 Tax=Macrococcoides canis TaxID=1855823 RepID=UPI001061B832|nr:hypothetical protein [Macrococcus canis]TDM30867.1 hypothetical protein ETI03_07415 [Macrococcus canis]TDM33758.1 hypothetical protein ETI13_07270 [Macrococcus canis]